MQMYIYILVSPSALPERAQAFVTTLLAKGVQHYAITPRGRCRFDNTTLPASASALYQHLQAYLAVFALFLLAAILTVLVNICKAAGALCSPCSQ